MSLCSICVHVSKMISQPPIFLSTVIWLQLRRERIAERMKALQELVPNSNKVLWCFYTCLWSDVCSSCVGRNFHLQPGIGTEHWKLDPEFLVTEFILEHCQFHCDADWQGVNAGRNHWLCQVSATSSKGEDKLVLISSSPFKRCACMSLCLSGEIDLKWFEGSEHSSNVTCYIQWSVQTGCVWSFGICIWKRHDLALC